MKQMACFQGKSVQWRTLTESKVECQQYRNKVAGYTILSRHQLVYKYILRKREAYNLSRRTIVNKR